MRPLMIGQDLWLLERMDLLLKAKGSSARNKKIIIINHTKYLKRI
jgi:hypothetical protein